MAVVHETHDGGRNTLATNLEYAETALEQARGLTFRRSLPPESAMVFPFDGAGTRTVHTVFVPFPIDVCWALEGTVDTVETLPAWHGFGRGDADTLFEFPAGTAASVEPGDAIRVEP